MVWTGIRLGIPGHLCIYLRGIVYIFLCKESGGIDDIRKR